MKVTTRGLKEQIARYRLDPTVTHRATLKRGSSCLTEHRAFLLPGTSGRLKSHSVDPNVIADLNRHRKVKAYHHSREEQ